MELEGQDVTTTLAFDAMATAKCVDRARSVYLSVRPDVVDPRTLDVLHRVGYDPAAEDHRLHIVLANDPG